MTNPSLPLSRRETAELLSLLETYMRRQNTLKSRLAAADRSREITEKEFSSREQNLLQNVQLMQREQMEVQTLLTRLKTKHRQVLERLKEENKQAKEAIEQYQEALRLQKVSIARLQGEKNELLRLGRKHKELTTVKTKELQATLVKLQADVRRKNHALARKTNQVKRSQQVEVRLRTAEEKVKRLESELQSENSRRKKYHSISEDWRARATQNKAELLALSARTKHNRDCDIFSLTTSTGQLKVFSTLKERIRRQDHQLKEYRKDIALLERDKRLLGSGCQRLDGEIQLLRKELALEREIREHPIENGQESVMEANRRLLKENRELKIKNQEAFRIINNDLRKELHAFLATTREV